MDKWWEQHESYWYGLDKAQRDAFEHALFGLGLSVRARNALINGTGIYGLEASIDSIARTPDIALLRLKNLGRHSLREIRQRIPFQGPEPCPQCGVPASAPEKVQKTRMRGRSSIELDLSARNVASPVADLLLEVLLDIRDLLKNSPVAQPALRAPLSPKDEALIEELAEAYADHVAGPLDRPRPVSQAQSDPVEVWVDGEPEESWRRYLREHPNATDEEMKKAGVI